MKKTVILLALIYSFFFTSCENNVENETPSLIIKFKFDPNQVRLNNLGQPSLVPMGNAAQNPIFNAISAHYFELAPTAFTQLGNGAVLYHAAETTAGGAIAIDFEKSIIVKEGETFLKIPLSQIPKGTYDYVRVSLSYQDYTIAIRSNNADYSGRLASFVGYNSYIKTHFIDNNSFPVNANKLQGYWAFALNGLPYSSSGQAPAGATTVPNPLAATSPIPAGSCVVTGKFESPLQITTADSKDITITLSLSINKSFEWHEVNFDGKYEPAAGENVVDMGLRGLIPSYQK